VFILHKTDIIISLNVTCSHHIIADNLALNNNHSSTKTCVKPYW